MKKGWHQRRSHKRRGAAYALVLAVTAMIGVLSLATLTNTRVLRRDVAHSDDWQEATWLAFSGMENAIARLKSDANWRTTYSNNVETTPLVLGRGTISFRLVDPDGNLADDTNDSVKLIATGRVGQIARSFSEELRPGGQGIAALQTAVHANGNVITQTTTVWNGCLSCNGTLSVSAGHQVSGNVQASAIANSGTITGTQTILASPLAMPSSSVFELYKARATTINFFSIPAATIERTILSATSNPYGPVNPEGIYYIEIPFKSYKLVIQQCRIKATLLIDIQEKGTLDIDDGLIWEPPAANMPSLIARGLTTLGAAVIIDGSGLVKEFEAGCNFNPPGMPYRGSENSTMTDEHLPVLRGLFHVIRQPGDTSETAFKGAISRRGCFLLDGDVSIKGSSFMNEPKLFEDAPVGYIAVPQMFPIPGTCQWEPVL